LAASNGPAERAKPEYSPAMAQLTSRAQSAPTEQGVAFGNFLAGAKQPTLSGARLYGSGFTGSPEHFFPAQSGAAGGRSRQWIPPQQLSRPSLPERSLSVTRTRFEAMSMRTRAAAAREEDPDENHES